ncbi:hypothetical protein HWB96_gp27 [Arthrobacter phage Mendel]|uniref:Uncharacterized protein n=1 Tax=Arthrobacter phage Mendel TaxID=2484218 RepID=A0A3G3M0T3_9CAUD|nr:hypothetical protein HWB96_gp27 [Arthrobacter phage Mendel]AYQ99941.1 hypothetical protein PBI_MENDEL_27 [Arthrobacter phage Mendel]
METLDATAHVQQLEYTYQAICPTCHWKSIPGLMRHRMQALADQHNALWHGGSECGL